MHHDRPNASPCMTCVTSRHSPGCMARSSIPTLHAALRIIQMFWYVTLLLAQTGSSMGGHDGGQTQSPRSHIPPLAHMTPSHSSVNTVSRYVSLKHSAQILRFITQNIVLASHVYNQIIIIIIIIIILFKSGNMAHKHKQKTYTHTDRQSKRRKRKKMQYMMYNKTQ